MLEGQRPPSLRNGRPSTAARPPHLKNFHGTFWRPRFDMKRPDPDIFAPPASITGEARREWVRVCAELTELGRLMQVDRAILTLHCTAWAMHRTAIDTVAKDGPSCILPNGCPTATPACKLWKETTAVLRGTLADLGLTPASRRKLATVEQEPDELEV